MQGSIFFIHFKKSSFRSVGVDNNECRLCLTFRLSSCLHQNPRILSVGTFDLCYKEFKTWRHFERGELARNLIKTRLMI